MQRWKRDLLVLDLPQNSTGEAAQEGKAAFLGVRHACQERELPFLSPPSPDGQEI